MHWRTFKYFLQQVKKKVHSKIHLHTKVFLGKNDLQSFYKVIPLAPSYKF